MLKTEIGTSERKNKAHALESLERLAERLTHKIRNPLSVITTAASQLDFSMGQTITEDDLYFAKVIMDAAENLDGILIKYMLYAAPYKPNKIENDINELCHNEFQNITAEFGDKVKNINIRYQNLTPSPLIHCDGEMIKLIFREILTNSIEELKSAENGEISAITDFDSDAAIIRIEDNGNGVFENKFKEILLPFITFRSGGTGLGLAVAKSLSDLHNGSIEISPKSDGGTIVSVRIPIPDKGDY